MKGKKQIKYSLHERVASELNDKVVGPEISDEPMVRTQIYLSRQEHNFVAAEARRRDQPMAAVIRSFIDEKMEIPEDAWTNNPMLRPFPPDPESKSPPDAAINHDHYLYGAPKSWIKQNGKWIETPPLPDDYFDNPASANAYDALILEMERKEKQKARR
jgi:hypothetical protein